MRKSALLEADGLVHGDRNNAYGHPLDDMSRTAAMVSAMLAHKLQEPLTAEDIALIMCQVKISRQINRPKRDNMVDLAGYAECNDWIIEERARREAPPAASPALEMLSRHVEPTPLPAFEALAAPIITPIDAVLDEPE